MKKFAGRILAMVLALSMITSILPMVPLASAAEGEPTYVLAGSDFQPTDANNATGVSLLNGILDKVNNNYSAMDGFLFAGDYDYSYTASQAGKEALQTAVQAVYGAGMHEVYVQGNHDSDSLVGSVLSSSGANDAENYGVFVINEKDYMWHNDDEATIKKTAENLKTYLDAKRNEGYTKPIFVVSHLPLHYCMRTREGGNDGMHANYIFNVLNEAGAAGLNIIFLFGHNHSHGWDDYLGGAAIFLTKGDKINIAQNSTTVFKEETLAFTYMNAGYVGYYGTTYTSEVDKTLTMTTFAITDTDVTISRYDSNGTHDLKSAGVYNVEHPDSAYYSTDTTTVGTPYTLTLNNEITPAGEEITPPDSGNTGSGTTPTERTYTRVTSTSDLVSGGKYLIIHNGQNDFMIPVVTSDGGTRIGYDLVTGPTGLGSDTITGNYQEHEWTFESTSGGWKIGSADGYMTFQAAGDRVAAQLTANGDTMVIGGSANSFTFTSATYSNGNYVLNYNSTGDLINGYAGNEATFYIYRMTNEGSSSPTVDPSGGGWVAITEPTEAGTKYVYELDTDGVDEGVEYLIVANSYPKALSAAASSNNAVDIEISGNYAYAASDTYGWTFTRYEQGVYYICLNGSTYLKAKDETLDGSGSDDKSCRWTVSSNNNGSYDIVRKDYHLRWSNSNGVFQASESNEGPVRLYKYVKTETTEAQAGLYGKISGELTYNVANGTSAEAALATVKAGITGYTSNSNTATTGTELADSELTWTLDPSYNGYVGGEYAVTIAYNGVTLGVAKVVVPTVQIDDMTINPLTGSVRQGSGQATKTGSTITVTLDDGNFYNVPVTVSMLSKNGQTISTAEAGTQTGLTVTYNGTVITNNFTLVVTEKVYNNYPEYPDEGAVKVNKTATGIDFQSTGIAQVEVSASGVPVKKGADVVVMLDLSSSMNNTVGGESRLTVLKQSLEKMMTQLKAKGSDGQPMDIRIAVADFHRYYTDSSSPYYINNADHLKDGSIRESTSGTNQVYTGSGALNADAFVSVHDLKDNEFESLNTQSGTNYDYAFDAVYQLGEAITEKNAAAGEERDLFVIFMSDGAPFQFNYFSAQSGSENEKTSASYWNNWLQGTMTNDMFDTNAHNDYYNEDGKHWMAEAIKGEPGTPYPVIRKNNAADTDGNTWVNVNGLGAKMYSIGFCLAVDKEITVESMDAVIRNIASSENYYYRADTADALNNAFTTIGRDIAYAANNARFVDQMGNDFSLQMKSSTYSVVDGTTTTNKTITPKIEIISYDIYTRQDFLNSTITEDKIGDRKGTYKILETVTFNADGTEAYSDQIGGGKTNILADGTQAGYAKGVIYAKTFLYNTTSAGVAIKGVNIPTKTGYTNELPAETFYWKMGTVQSSELAMRYYVYLDGSMEGTREAGSYPTNKYATLYYDNYLGNPCYKDTTSPVMAWKEANVSYAFYLVNEDGEIIVNQTTGQTGSFANKIAVTKPVVYDTVLLNTSQELNAVTASAVLPEGYALYDAEYDAGGNITAGAVYKVTVNSNTTGGWEVSSVKDKATTYVTQYNPKDASAYSNTKNVNQVGLDYTHTTVWFAVVWKVQALPDAVVIDYGLPVDISVLANDMFGENGELAGVGAYSDSLNLNSHDTALASGFGMGYTGKYGDAKADAVTGKVRYTPTSMEMSSYDKFAYAVNYTGNENAGYYYDTVTVIPATSIYYEDSFVKFDSGTWETAGTTLEDAHQDEDRPGQYALTDANNIYGYDSVNKGMTTYSLGSARVATVTAGNSASATFTFTGTGFDIISMTSGETGLVTVEVYQGSTANADNLLTRWAVDTYYGYTYKDGGWEATPSADNALYQVPVMKSGALQWGYDTYTVKIIAEYIGIFDHNTTDSGYKFYLDAIRIYDPANGGVADGTTDTTIEDVYTADHEGWPSYIELRNKLIGAGSFDNVANEKLGEDIEGMVFIDGKGNIGDDQISDYANYGPNNEVYLAPGQSVAFQLSTPANIDKVHIGVKSADGKTVGYEIKNVAAANIEDGNKTILAGTIYNVGAYTVDTSTDMYYDLTGWKNDIIVIKNTGGGILSLTNIKSTYTSDPNGTVTARTMSLRSVAAFNPNETYIYMTPEAAGLVVASLNGTVEQEPSVFAPETFDISVDKQSVKVGQKVKVTVTTSSDVEKVVINGADAKKGRTDKKTDTTTWTIQVKAESAGNLLIAAIAYDGEGLTSEPIGVVVDVTAKNGNSGSGAISGGSVGGSPADKENWEEIWQLIMKRIALFFKDLGGMM